MHGTAHAHRVLCTASMRCTSGTESALPAHEQWLSLPHLRQSLVLVAKRPLGVSITMDGGLNGY